MLIVHLTFPGFGKRHILAILGFIGCGLSYTLRFNISVAIIAMVNTNTNLDNTASRSQNESSQDTCSSLILETETGTMNESNYEQSLGDMSLSFNDPSSTRFNWSEADQGLIHGAFFWGLV